MPKPKPDVDELDEKDWMVQFKKASAPQWQLLYLGRKGTAKIIMEKKQKEYPSYQFRLIKRD